MGILERGVVGRNLAIALAVWRTYMKPTQNRTQKTYLCNYVKTSISSDQARSAAFHGLAVSRVGVWLKVATQAGITEVTVRSGVALPPTQ